MRNRARTGLLAVLAVMALVSAAACRPSAAREDRLRPDPEAARAATPVATFSIVAHDPDTGDLGVAVESRFFAVGAVVPWARAGVGAVATQAIANPTYGPRGLDLLAAGDAPSAVVDALTGNDDHRAERQVGVVGADGEAATYTGADCLTWAGGHAGEHYAVQGNILAGPQVVDAMAAAFETADGDLASRMLSALAAGQAAGGDARGRQSAALLVVRAGGGYGGLNDRYVDLRVDDHPAPIRELGRLLDIRHGQIAGAEAGRLLRDGDATGALESARRATSLNPDDGFAWMTRAAASLATGDRAGAVAAGRQALLVDPWLKSGALSGVLELPSLDELLQIEAFARLWEAVPGR